MRSIASGLREVIGWRAGHDRLIDIVLALLTLQVADFITQGLVHGVSIIQIGGAILDQKQQAPD